ncbi:hypothetical protein QQ045_022899 [Rhodiola kirilowii]
MNQNQTAGNVTGVSSSPELRKPNRQTAASDGVKLWYLRKLRNFRTFSPYDSDTHSNSGTNGSVQSEILFHKDPGVFMFEDDWAFPRKMTFNGQDCVMPSPEDFPKLPKRGIGSYATMNRSFSYFWLWSFLLVTGVLLFH